MSLRGLIINSDKLEDKKIIKRSFNYLLEVFQFNPTNISPYKIEVSILNSIEKFIDIYIKEYDKEPPEYVIGFYAKNGRLFILNKNLFEKRNHSKNEFKKVIVHELCHIFIKRMLDPKNTFRWIEEGICQYFAFRDYNFKIEKVRDLKKLSYDKSLWEKFHPYGQAAEFFKFLSKNYGGDKRIIEFLRKIKEKNEFVAFKEVFGDFDKIQNNFFKEVLGKDLK